MNRFLHTSLLLGLLCLSAGAAEPARPRTVQQLWADYDPRAEPLEVKVVREWAEGKGVYRYVLYTIGTFKGEKARMAAFYGFPKGGRDLPAVMHMHGGGQRAFLRQVRYYVGRGYACLSVNWGGREMEEAKPGEPTTDWGAVDPTQKNVPGYFNLLPGPKHPDPVESPRNCNWYLLTVGCRRGLTFLERQPEVDPNRLGVYGHSMGGNLTTYVAGADGRVKVAAASAGGQGFRCLPWPLLPQQRPNAVKGDADLYRATMGYQNYAPLIRAPFLHLGATNDFHGIMDNVYRTNERIPHDNVRCSFAPHLNHRFEPPQAVTSPLWIDQHLKGTFAFPETPATQLTLDTPGRVPKLTVTPDPAKPVAKVDVYYSIDPDPRARFWRDAGARKAGDGWSAALPVMGVDMPLLAFANVYYKLKKPEGLTYAESAETFCLSSQLHTASPEALRRAGVVATDKPSPLIDDFSRGFHDWYLLSGDNPHHWQFWTRKITDPKWRGPAGAAMAIELEVARDNTLVVIVVENEWRGYRGRRKTYLAVKKIAGAERPQRIVLKTSDFTCVEDGGALGSWAQLDQLGLRAYYEAKSKTDPKLVGSKQWRGPPPKLRKLEWVR